MELTEEQRAVLTPEQIAKLEGVVEPEITPTPTPTQETNNADDIASQILNAINKQQQQSNNQAMQVLWQQQLDTVTSSIPGLSDYLNDEDEYGENRLDKINSVENYQSRVEKLNGIANRFKQATIESGGVPPVLDRKAVQLAKENETRYNDIEKKVGTGDYKSINEFNEDFFDAISSEMDSLVS